jgi:ferredoxin
VRDARDLPALDAELGEAPAQGVSKAASFAVQPKSAPRSTSRSTTCCKTAPAAPAAPRRRPSRCPLPRPSAAINVNKDACTLCLSCVSACPASALQDNAERPQLRFIEKNCVQCGLCASTCPESAITLQPRLLLSDERRQLRVLNEAQPYQCVRCSKPFGTLKGIELMLAKLGGHAMFQGEALQRLKMCGDCRVVDIYTNPGESKITDL